MARNPPLVIPNCVQVRLLCIVSNQGAINVLHATKSAGLTITQGLTDTIGAAIKSAYTANIAPLSNANSSLVRVGLRDLTNPNMPEFLDAGAPVSSAIVADALPPQTALCVTLKTANSGKSFRGRVYVGGWSETANSATGTATGGAPANAVAYIQAISAALTTNGLTLAVASRPAYAYVITKTTTFQDATTQVETIGRGAARNGSATAVTLIQSRNATFESQRRRANPRGAVPTLFALPEAEVRLTP